ncbi:hypothetical protein [Achromobacter insolitus]|uniref:Uncharacterized protein n=1 Tax=Achromobacter insolitus TaxID=217204 RepID=A0A6S7EZY9_9BURK|nr:hypothetical protein [Achromobacter insolitus]CAB3931574.1 hypothetical protein LMG6000_02222 [Achromobacter insolitus]CAB3939445.1 hypothetical protein LMG5997_04039 [Achromobacter insolitus]
MIRRLLKDRDNRVAAYVVAGVLTALIFGYGDRQQRDEQAQSTLTACEGCGKSAVAARQP